MSAPDSATALAGLHATAFEAPWDASAMAVLLAQPGVFAVAEDDGFVLCRAVADEAEILTIAVRPEARGRGLGSRLVAAGAQQAEALGAMRLFLEVAEDNHPALALYAGAGFVVSGRRRGYYGRADGSRVDALVMSRNLG